DQRLKPGPDAGGEFPGQLGSRRETQLQPHELQHLIMLIGEIKGVAEPGGDDRHAGQDQQAATKLSIHEEDYRTSGDKPRRRRAARKAQPWLSAFLAPKAAPAPGPALPPSGRDRARPRYGRLLLL